MKFSDEKIGLAVKMLREKPLLDTAYEFGLDKTLKTTEAMQQRVYRWYMSAKRDPERFGLTEAHLDSVQEAMNNRKGFKSKLQAKTIIIETPADQMSVRQKEEKEANPDFKDLVLDNRKKTWILLKRKLDRISRSNKTLDDVNLTALTAAAAMVFDKGQVIQGEATENVALLAKIDNNMKPEDALNMVLKMREQNLIDKEKKVTK